MTEPSQRIATTKEWFIGTTCLSLFVIGFCWALSGFPTQGTLAWLAPLGFFAFMELMMFLFWMMARRSGYSGMPIR